MLSIINTTVITGLHTFTQTTSGKNYMHTRKQTGLMVLTPVCTQLIPIYCAANQQQMHYTRLIIIPAAELLIDFSVSQSISSSLFIVTEIFLY